MNNEEIARKHFEAFQWEGPLVGSYRISDMEWLVIARPNGSGHRLSMVCYYTDVDSKLVEYTKSLIDNWGYNDLRIIDREIFEGEVV